MQIAAMGSDRASGVLAHRAVTPTLGSPQSGPVVQSSREESKSRCRPVSDAHPHKKRRRLPGSFPLPATQRLSTAPGLGSVLDRLERQTAAAGSVRYDDNCRGVIGLKASRVPVLYSCVTPRNGGVLPQAETRGGATGPVRVPEPLW